MVSDPALQQFLRLHARTDDFVTTVAKARQNMVAQEQAKISAISKKPIVRLAALEEPSPDRIQPILDGLQKVLQTVLDNQSRPPACLLYTSPSPRDRQKSRMPSSA